VLTPNLTYAIISCAAIITEVGGFLSHGAIFAREMGIPAIVQMPGVTELLENGEEVLVDAEQGLIQRIRKHTIQ
jgi:pyruvate,water dikinase